MSTFNCRTLKRHLYMTALALLLVVTATSAFADHNEKTGKKGILLVAFGTSVPEAQAAFANIDAMVKEKFGNISVFWAYTSHIIRHKLAKQGHPHLSTAEALARMADQGFTTVAVQSLHTIPGEEFHAMQGIAKAFETMPDGFSKVTVGRPLLNTNQDMMNAAKALLASVPAERQSNEAVVFMGHGTPHPANIYYPGMQYYMERLDPLAFVGTVEGTPSLDDVLKELRQANVKKAYLIPLMSVAGDHARNDMAGDEDDSWISVLTKAGITCIPVLQGMAEKEPVVAIWVQHLQTAVDQLQ